MPNHRANASINRTDNRGTIIRFAPEFSDPFVDVERRRRTVEHETINDEFYVQTISKRPDKLTIEGVIWDYQLYMTDSIIDHDEVEVITERWTGTASPERVSTTYRREADNDNGNWIYDVTIDLIEVSKSLVTDNAQDRAGISYATGEEISTSGASTEYDNAQDRADISYAADMPEDEPDRSGENRSIYQS